MPRQGVRRGQRGACKEPRGWHCHQKWWLPLCWRRAGRPGGSFLVVQSVEAAWQGQSLGHQPSLLGTSQPTEPLSRLIPPFLAGLKPPRDLGISKRSPAELLTWEWAGCTLVEGDADEEAEELEAPGMLGVRAVSHPVCTSGYLNGKVIPVWLLALRFLVDSSQICCCQYRRGLWRLHEQHLPPPLLADPLFLVLLH